MSDSALSQDEIDAILAEVEKRQDNKEETNELSLEQVEKFIMEITTEGDIQMPSKELDILLGFHQLLEKYLAGKNNIKPKKYRLKTEQIEAMEINAYTYRKIQEWAGNDVVVDQYSIIEQKENIPPGRFWMIKNKAHAYGNNICVSGDYIIKTGDEFYACPREKFLKNYEEVL